jgi:hypothetical protein
VHILWRLRWMCAGKNVLEQSTVWAKILPRQENIINTPISDHRKVCRNCDLVTIFQLIFQPIFIVALNENNNAYSSLSSICEFILGSIPHTWCLLFGYIDRSRKHTREIYIFSFSRIFPASATRLKLLYICPVNGYPPFHIFCYPVKFDEICLLEISMQIPGSATRLKLLYMCIVNGYPPFHIFRLMKFVC